MPANVRRFLKGSRQYFFLKYITILVNIVLIGASIQMFVINFEKSNPVEEKEKSKNPTDLERLKNSREILFIITIVVIELIFLLGLVGQILENFWVMVVYDFFMTVFTIWCLTTEFKLGFLCNFLIGITTFFGYIFA